MPTEKKNEMKAYTASKQAVLEYVKSFFVLFFFFFFHYVFSLFHGVKPDMPCGQRMAMIIVFIFVQMPVQNPAKHLFFPLECVLLYTLSLIERGREKEKTCYIHSLSGFSFASAHNINRKNRI